MSNRHVKKLKISKGDLVAGKRLVGRRIDPKTALGTQLAKLRVAYASAARLETPHDDLYRRMLETSLNVEAPLDLLARQKEREQRKKVIRERIQRSLDAVFAEHGRYPDTVGIPRESLDEVAEACDDFPVKFVPLEEE